MGRHVETRQTHSKNPDFALPTPDVVKSHYWIPRQNQEAMEAFIQRFRSDFGITDETDLQISWDNLGIHQGSNTGCLLTSSKDQFVQDVMTRYFDNAFFLSGITVGERDIEITVIVPFLHAEELFDILDHTQYDTKVVGTTLEIDEAAEIGTMRIQYFSANVDLQRNLLALLTDKKIKI